MKKLDATEEQALATLQRWGSICPGTSSDPIVARVRTVLDALVKKRRARIEATDDGPRYHPL